MAVFRTINLDTLEPSELAELFCDLHDDQQAQFFDAVGAIAAGWPGTGWCGQAGALAKHLTPLGRRTVKTLAGHTV